MLIKDLLELMNEAELQLYVSQQNEGAMYVEIFDKLQAILNTDPTTHNIEELQKLVEENKKII